ncbi:hypothetical protein Droror1_Dr00011957 [Drosera rotundifolia]
MAFCFRLLLNEVLFHCSFVQWFDVYSTIVLVEWNFVSCCVKFNFELLLLFTAHGIHTDNICPDRIKFKTWIDEIYTNDGIKLNNNIKSIEYDPELRYEVDIGLDIGLNTHVKEPVKRGLVQTSVVDEGLRLHYLLHDTDAFYTTLEIKRMAEVVEGDRQVVICVGVDQAQLAFGLWRS